MEVKKNKNIDFNQHRTLLLAVGLLLSTFLVSMTFNIRSSYQPVIPYDPPPPFDAYLPVIPITEFEEPREKEKLKPKAPPKVITTEVPIINVKPTLELIQDPIEDITMIEDTFAPIPPEAIVTEFLVVEEQASFPGGNEAWRKYLKSNFKYPKMAKRSGIEGRVYLSFYVDTEGNLSNIEVVRGIGGGCDEEAIRVLTNSPKWNPGKQRGVAVKSPMSLFITFKLK